MTYQRQGLGYLTECLLLTKPQVSVEEHDMSAAGFG
jgi:hypothetical protein